MLISVEKVIFHQDVDIFKFTSSENLVHITVITEEIELEVDNTIFKGGTLGNVPFKTPEKITIDKRTLIAYH